jgi:V/A-type H+-transporting ATPase subunit E
MGDLNALKKGIIDEAREEAARLRSEAEERAAEILAEAKKASEERRREIVRNGDQEAAEIRRRIEIASELDKKRDLLSAKGRAINEAVTLALQKLYNLSQDQKTALFSASILKSVESGAEVIRPAAADKALLEKILPEVNNTLKAKGLSGRLHLGAVEPDIQGGFIIVGEHFQADCSIESMLLGIKDDLIPEVARVLFE